MGDGMTDDLAPFPAGQSPYAVIAERLAARIRAEEFNAAGQLPAQAALCRHYGYSTETVGRAVRSLDKDGIVAYCPRTGVYLPGRQPPGASRTTRPTPPDAADPVNRRADKFPYEQVAERLEARIRAGEFGDRGRIPAERQLARDYGVTTRTVKHAKSVLTTAGLIIAVKGWGTFAVRPSALPQKSSPCHPPLRGRSRSSGIALPQRMPRFLRGLRSPPHCRGRRLSDVTEAQWIVVAGVVTALAGSLVAAPDGARLILREVFSGTAQALGWVFRRRRVVRQSMSTGFSSTFNVGANLTGDVTRKAGRPFMEQIERLWEVTDSLQRQISEVRQEMPQIEARLSSDLQAASGELRSALAKLTERVEEQERQAVRIDARGLPLVGLGIVLTGIPNYLAAWVWPGWSVVAITAVLVFWLAILPLTRWVFTAARGR